MSDRRRRISGNARRHRTAARSPEILIRPRCAPADQDSRAALLAATRIELRSVLRSIPFILLTILWAGLAAMEILSDVAGGEYGAAFYPTTSLILGTLRQPLGLVATVIIIYYSAELIWRERSVGMAEILNATPASNAVFVLSKWIALTRDDRRPDRHRPRRRNRHPTHARLPRLPSRAAARLRRDPRHPADDLRHGRGADPDAEPIEVLRPLRRPRRRRLHPGRQRPRHRASAADVRRRAAAAIHAR